MTGYPSARAWRTGRRPAFATLGVAGLLALSGCAQEDTPGSDETTTQAETDAAAGDAAASATLMDPEGTEVGTATFTESAAGFDVDAQVQGLDPGFYGFHIHGVGECEPDSAAPDDPEGDTGPFLSAGGHLGGDEAEHPGHAGDLPSLLVTDAGEGRLAFTTDRITLEDLTDEDGAALMVHDGQDNYANIPERYAPDGPDEDSLGTGDAGGRLACGVIEATG